MKDLIFKAQQSIDSVQVIAKSAIPFPVPGLEGSSTAIEGVRQFVRRCAPTNTAVLISGPTGSGKERVAQSIHQHSERSQHPFVVVDCGAIPHELFESELFGHVEGAFTGAIKDRKGAFLAANGGSIYFDEIANLPLDLQAKLLRAIQSKVITPVGSSQSFEIDVRIIASTQQDLEQLVAENKFREDLLYRIRVIDLKLPSLFERRLDLPALCDSILKKLSKNQRKPRLELSSQALEKMLLYPWPGNIRELENVLEHGATLSWAESRSVIELTDLPHSIRWATMDGPKHKQLKDAVKKFEQEYILETLERLGGSKEEAAEALGLSLATLYRKIGNDS